MSSRKPFFVDPESPSEEVFEIPEPSPEKRPAEDESSQRRKLSKPEKYYDLVPEEVKEPVFIGTLAVDAWCTRSLFGLTIKPGDMLTLTRPPEQEVVKSKRGGARAMSQRGTLVRVAYGSPKQPKTLREFGRLREEHASWVAPLIDHDIVVFKPKYADEPKRLTTSDNFVLELECYIHQDYFTTASDFASNMRGLYQSADKPVDHSKQTSLTLLLVRLNYISDSLKTRFGLPSRQPEKKRNPETPETSYVDLTFTDDEDVSVSSVPEKNYNLDQLKQFYRFTQASAVGQDYPETVPPSSEFGLELRPYQKLGLSWMLKREKEFSLIGSGSLTSTQNARYTEELINDDKSQVNPLWTAMTLKGSDRQIYYNRYTGEFSLKTPTIEQMCRGGILADEMGLGKTITTYSLIFTAPQDSSFDSAKSFDEKYAYKTTMIVVPMALLTQWQSEFEKLSIDTGVKCSTYYGNPGFDISSECCTDQAPRVLLTTYGTIQHEYSRMVKHGSAFAGIFGVKFFRIVLDEAHNIRNKQTRTSKAVTSLKASRKWALTGTPIINSLDDLFPLVNFLEVDPWSSYALWKHFIKDPSESTQNIFSAFDVLSLIMEPLILRRTKTQKDKNGNLLIELPEREVVFQRLYFNEQEKTMYQWMMNRAASSFASNMKSGTLFKNYSSILTHILRLRQVCCHLDLIKSTREGIIEEEEGIKLDQKVLLAQTEEFETEAQRILAEEEEAEAFSIDRQVELKTEIYAQYPNFTDTECSICTTSPISVDKCVITECKHCFCLECLMEHFEYQGRATSEDQENVDPQTVSLKSTKIVQCPNCRSVIDKKRLFRTKPTTDVLDGRGYSLYHFNPYGRSTKINALIQALYQIKEGDCNERVIVFSQFSSFLDLIQAELWHYSNEFEVIKMDGRVGMKGRQDIIDRFSDPEPKNKVTVLLLSMKVGGVGLNLTAASKAFMMDPWWSPSLEEQAIDRLHRMGQKKNVRVVRFIMRDSIEERMLKIQERKKQIGEAVGVDDAERRKRRIEEIEILFGK